jgi:prophage regulatory protein
MTTIYRLPKLKTEVGLSRSTIYAEIKKGKFPAPVPLTDGGRAVGWDSNAVDAWVAARVQMVRTKAGSVI